MKRIVCVFVLFVLLVGGSAYAASPRRLNLREWSVLAYIVVDPNAWWAHISGAPNIPNPESILAAKVSRWGAEYDSVYAAQTVNYKTRAQRDSIAFTKH